MDLPVCTASGNADILLGIFFFLFVSAAIRPLGCELIVWNIKQPRCFLYLLGIWDYYVMYRQRAKFVL